MARVPGNASVSSAILSLGAHWASLGARSTIGTSRDPGPRPAGANPLGLRPALEPGPGDVIIIIGGQTTQWYIGSAPQHFARAAFRCKTHCCRKRRERHEREDMTLRVCYAASSQYDLQHELLSGCSPDRLKTSRALRDFFSSFEICPAVMCGRAAEPKSSTWHTKIFRDM